MSVSSAKAKLDAQGGDPVTGYISKTDVQESYDELVNGTALTGTTTIAALTLAGVSVGSGTGSPEGSVAAPVGSVWTDKSATTGAVLWVKVSGASNTGWQVAYGDTGWRNLTLLSPWTGTMHVRRVNRTVTWRFLDLDGGTIANNVYTIPAGLHPQRHSRGYDPISTHHHRGHIGDGAGRLCAADLGRCHQLRGRVAGVQSRSHRNVAHVATRLGRVDLTAAGRPGVVPGSS